MVRRRWQDELCDIGTAVAVTVVGAFFAVLLACICIVAMRHATGMVKPPHHAPTVCVHAHDEFHDGRTWSLCDDRAPALRG